MDFKALIFDMDGVLLDSEKLVRACWQAVADKHGIKDIIETCNLCLGGNQAATIEIFKERYGEDFPYDLYKAEMRELFFGPFYGDFIPLKEGVKELLSALKDAKIPMAVASSTRREIVLKELKESGIDFYFDAFICGDIVAHSKPDPEIFLKACQALGVEPSDAYAIEDAYTGIRAAAAGGLRPIMVPDLAEPTEEMEKLCEVICRSCFEVKEYLFG